MRITPFDGLFRFHVNSLSRPTLKHLVDLTSYNGNGACGCENFERECQKHLEKGAKPADIYRCKHIRLARLWLGKQLLEHAIKNQIQTDRARKQEAKRRAERVPEEGDPF